MTPQLGSHQQEQLDDLPNLQHFQQFLAKSLILAKNPAAKKQQKFVPFQELESYFAVHGRLDDILYDVFSSDEDDPLPDIDTIKESYLKSFCVLLCIGKARYISRFIEHACLDDSKLPFTSKPGNFPIAPGQDFWDSFSAQQWTFCAQVVKYKENLFLNPKEIFPIIEYEVVASGGTANVSRITLHESFDRLPCNRDSSSAKHVYILKTYRGNDAKLYYDNEVDAFKRLRAKQRLLLDTNIVEFYGSYRQNDTFNVILEYADEGTLEDYFRAVFPPRSGTDIHHFWESLCGVLKALTQIHEVECHTRSGPQIFQGWHQDVKPKNILVVSNGALQSYRWKFKLADLGLSHFKRTSQGNSDLDAYGTETYGAPECYRAADKFIQTSSIFVKRNVDIWSFGCILSEAAVWIVHGFEGLETYRASRRRQICQVPGTKNGDWFHDGDNILPVVLQTLDELKCHLSNSDQITKFIIDSLVKDMLDNTDSRSPASRLWTIAQREFRKTSTIETSPILASSPLSERSENERFPQSPTHHDMITPSTPVFDNSRPCEQPVSERVTVKIESLSSSPTSPQQTLDHTSPNTNPNLSISGSVFAPNEKHTGPPLPTLTIEDAESWILAKKKRGSALVKELSDDYLLRQLETRDHMFVIDDAKSMKTHTAEVKRTLSTLAYLVKKSDPDGIELYFTGSTQKTKSNKSSVLVDAFDHNEPQGLTDIRIRLRDIIDKYIGTLNYNSKFPFRRVFKSSHQLNLYVLTDGIWQPGSDLIPLIQRLVTEIKGNGHCHVGIQFISFGNNLDALQRLDSLDNDLGVGHIVDHEPFNGNIWKMLFGATNPWFDKGNSSTGPT